MKVKSCPFCGNIPAFITFECKAGRLYKVICKPCFCEAGNDSSSPAAAVRVWNRRRPETTGDIVCNIQVPHRELKAA